MCARDTSTIRPRLARLLIKPALNRAVLSRRDREHVRKEPRSTRNAMYLSLSSSRIASQSFTITNRTMAVVIDLLQGS